MTDKTSSKDQNYSAGTRLKQELIEIRDEIQELLESASKLKISRAIVDIKVKLIDDERARKLIQETYSKRNIKPERFNIITADPVEEYLKKRSEIDLQLDLMKHLDFVVIDKSQSNKTKEENGILNQEKAIDMRFVGGTTSNNPKPRKEKEKSSGFNEPQTVGQASDNRVDLAELYRKTPPKSIGFSPAKENTLNSPGDPEEQSLPNKPSGENNLHVKHIGQSPAESQFQLKSITLEQKKAKTVVTAEEKEAKPVAKQNESVDQSRSKNISYGNLLEESKDDDYNEHSISYQKETPATKSNGMPMFSNPFDPSKENQRNAGPNLNNLSMQEKNSIQQSDRNVLGTQVSERGPAVVQGLKPHGLQYDANNHRNLAEKLLRPDSSFDASAENLSNRDKSFGKQEEDTLISGALKDLRKLNVEEKLNKQNKEREHPQVSPPKFTQGESNKTYLKYDSTITNSDLGTAKKNDRGFEWEAPESFSPYMRWQKFDFQKPIIEEEFEQTQGNQNIRFTNVEEDDKKKIKGSSADKEQGSTHLNVKNKMPEWYGQDPNTELIENMYMVDAVRYNNFNYVHNPSQSPEKKIGGDNLNKGVRHASPTSLEAKNLSHKIEDPKGLQKFDKRIPRVICFVTKYNGGDLEEDNDEEDSQQDANKEHQRVSKVGANTGKIVDYGQKLLKSDESDPSFDFDGHGKAPQKGVRKQYSGSFEEDEGVRQNVRPSRSYPNQHS